MTSAGEFYAHCVACDTRLDHRYSKKGLCGPCQRVVNKAANPDFHEGDMNYVENELWRNPLGSPEQAIFDELDMNGLIKTDGDV